MRSGLFSVLLVTVFSVVRGQDTYSVRNIHAHNDYEVNVPFTQAYDLGIGSIEADVILRNDTLYVAHDIRDIANRRLYFEMHCIRPLDAAVRNGKSRDLVLLIDLKTEANATLEKVVSIIGKYPALTSDTTIRFVITGNHPPAGTFDSYPRWILFDGRINNAAHFKHLDRIGLFSNSFRDFSRWNGNGEMSADERKKIQDAVEKVHAAGKKVRFWAAPDGAHAWRVLMDLKIDYINTDRIEELAAFMKR